MICQTAQIPITESEKTGLNLRKRPLFGTPLAQCWWFRVSPIDGIDKRILPEKICFHGERPLKWWKKWTRDREQIPYCGDAYRKGKNSLGA